MKNKWRNFIGWILGISLACFYIPKYLFGNFLWIYFCIKSKSFQPYPLSSDSLIELITGILGFSGIKTVEKVFDNLKNKVNKEENPT